MKVYRLRHLLFQKRIKQRAIPGVWETDDPYLKIHGEIVARERILL